MTNRTILQGMAMLAIQMCVNAADFDSHVQDWLATLDDNADIIQMTEIDFETTFDVYDYDHYVFPPCDTYAVENATDVDTGNFKKYRSFIVDTYLSGERIPEIKWNESSPVNLKLFRPKTEPLGISFWSVGDALSFVAYVFGKVYEHRHLCLEKYMKSVKNEVSINSIQRPSNLAFGGSNGIIFKDEMDIKKYFSVNWDDLVQYVEFEAMEPKRCNKLKQVIGDPLCDKIGDKVEEWVNANIKEYRTIAVHVVQWEILDEGSTSLISLKKQLDEAVKNCLKAAVEPKKDSKKAQKEVDYDKLCDEVLEMIAIKISCLAFEQAMSLPKQMRVAMELPKKIRTD